MVPTPYEVLRIPRDCTNDAIRHAYRRLAKEYHPDSNPDDPQAKQRFIEISDAYQAIGTEQKRKLWDLMNPPQDVRAAASPPPSPPPSPSSRSSFQQTAAAQPIFAPRRGYQSPPSRRASSRTSARRQVPGDLVRFALVCGLLVTVVVAGLSLGGRPQFGTLTPEAVALLVNGGPRVDATVTEMADDASGFVYQYQDQDKKIFTGRCNPCPYPDVKKMKSGDAVRVIHLTGRDFSAPLFAFADLTRVDRELADRINGLAAQSPTLNATP
jgi:hypothetical protein